MRRNRFDGGRDTKDINMGNNSPSKIRKDMRDSMVKDKDVAKSLDELTILTGNLKGKQLEDVKSIYNFSYNKINHLSISIYYKYK